MPVLFKSNVQRKQGLDVITVFYVYQSLRQEVPEVFLITINLQKLLLFVNMYNFCLNCFFYQGTTYDIVATIVDFDFTDDWKYIKCSTCRKKAQFIDSSYYCAVCKQNVATPHQA